MSKRDAKPKFVYVTYIASTPEKVWQAPTDQAITEKYWFGFRVAANSSTGDYMTASSPGSKEVHHDVILEGAATTALLRLAPTLQGDGRRAAVACDVRPGAAKGTGEAHGRA